MRKRILMAALVAAAMLGTGFTAAAATCGGPRGHEMDPAKKVDRMAAVLDLSADQQAQIKTILEKSGEKTAPLREKMNASREKLRQATRAGTFDEAAVRTLAAEQAQAKTELMVERARTRSQIHALLTPEQVQKAEKLRELHKERPEGMHRGR